MIDLLSKPAEEIGPADIDALVASALPEGDQIEFKRSLSTTKGKRDPWEHGKEPGDNAKTEILEEVTAFANVRDCFSNAINTSSLCETMAMLFSGLMTTRKMYTQCANPNHRRPNPNTVKRKTWPLAKANCSIVTSRTAGCLTRPNNHLHDMVAP